MRDQDVFLERALLEAGVVSTETVREARRRCAEQTVDLTDALVQMEVATSRQIALVHADVCEAPFVDLTEYEPSFINVRLIPRAVAERYHLFPLFMIDGVLTVGMDDPLNLEATDQARQLAKCEVDAVLCDREQLRSLIARAYSFSQTGAQGATDDVNFIELSATDNSQPVIAAVNQLLADAIEQRVSDVHLNPDEHELHLRYRIDGVLQQRQGPPKSMHSSIVQRLKVMAGLDLTQTRRPQDGKFRFRHQGIPVDVRLSTVPTVTGENVVMRLLAHNQSIHDFHELGVPAPMSADLDALLEHPYGMVLVTGPTGSGKTTTLYTALNKLNQPSRNIMTIEDPVEIRMPYVRQIQVHHEIGLTFANALRSILRQDPDVVLVGEIRDDETARIALQAALTGHLVLSTLHTNDAAGAVARLRDYNLPSFVINSAVLGVLAQRLVRRVCAHCAGPAMIDDLTRQRFRLSDHMHDFVQGRGCGKCSQTGYRGRVGLYELLKFTPTVQALVEKGASVDHIRRVAVDGGMRLMWQDGFDKARLGQTTLEEVTKVAAVVQVSERDEEEEAAPLRQSA